jgi:hypothetical protein
MIGYYRVLRVHARSPTTSEGGRLRSHLRVKRNFLKQINLILAVQSWAKKYSAFAVEAGQVVLVM